jgi:hypothetical protein
VETVGWLIAALFTTLLITGSGRYVVSLTRSGLGRALPLIGALLVITIWGVVTLLWLLATKVV